MGATPPAQRTQLRAASASAALQPAGGRQGLATASLARQLAGAGCGSFRPASWPGAVTLPPPLSGPAAKQYSSDSLQTLSYRLDPSVGLGLVADIPVDGSGDLDPAEAALRKYSAAVPAPAGREGPWKSPETLISLWADSKSVSLASSGSDTSAQTSAPCALASAPAALGTEVMVGNRPPLPALRPPALSAFEQALALARGDSHAVGSFDRILLYILHFTSRFVACDVVALHATSPES